ncbi:MAG: bifunctional demethylmenaquinone methyltransferase/2-methoxy-6-polyprenyl-1,4-benzoquinol methylase UbiE [Gammaproteobacteria bacterium]
MTESVDFGFRRVSSGEKTRRVKGVFTSVADDYDLMNDLMSLGVHRLWKRFSVHIAGLKPDARVLDLAGGTGDMTALIKKRLNEKGHIVLCDINGEMLRAGRDKLYDNGICQGLDFVQADAEALPYPDNSFDCVMVAFGLRNITDKQAALQAIHAKLKYGGVLNILEFSRLTLPLLQKLYDRYSFSMIPLLGRLVAGDQDSYQYLVESIRMHPDQETLKDMLQQAGFARVQYYNLSAGIVAHHQAWKL